MLVYFPRYKTSKVGVFAKYRTSVSPPKFRVLVDVIYSLPNMFIELVPFAKMFVKQFIELCLVHKVLR